MKKFLSSAAAVLMLWALTSLPAYASETEREIVQNVRTLYSELTRLLPPVGPAPSNPGSVPLNGGASLLLAGGVALGLRQLRKHYRTRQPLSF